MLSDIKSNFFYQSYYLNLFPYRLSLHFMLLLPKTLKICCDAELTRADVNTLSKPERNYNGATRSYCPANAYVGNQPVNRHDSSLRLRQLRSEMIRVAAVQGPALDGYIITSDDEHQVSIEFNIIDIINLI